MKKLLVICLVFSCLVFSTKLCAQNLVENFRFTTDYYYLDLKGNVGQRQEIIGTYSRDLSAMKARWTNITIANNAKDSAERLLPAENKDALNGFTYALHTEDVTKEGFFRDAPSATMQEINLVWDTRMFETFAEDHFGELELNKPFHLPAANIPLAGAGTFQNKDVQLTLTGTSTCNDAPCAVVDYRAFFNTFELKTRKETLVGRSHYWGQVWVSTATKRIVRGTLYEDVLGQVTSEASPRPQPVNVFRIGLFERVRQ